MVTLGCSHAGGEPRTVVRGPGREHGGQNAEPPIGDAAQGARVRVTPPAQRRVVLPGSGVVLRADPRPVVERRAQALVAGVAHGHQALLPLCLVTGAVPPWVRSAW